MTNNECRSPGWRRRLAKLFFALGFALAISRCEAAEEFGDISVSPNAIYTGNTFHGYAEMRVILENRSAAKAHIVTLVYPNRGYRNYGNSLSRVARTVSLAPETREVVSLLLPPLPAQGDGSISVDVDGAHEGEVRAPNANNHCNYYSRGGSQLATAFISRGLDYDAVSRALQAASGAFTAAKATGPPDSGSGGSGGTFQPFCWMPDVRSPGRTNWLELDYLPAQTVTKIVVHGRRAVSTGVIELVGVSGTNVAQIPMSSGRISSVGANAETEFSLPATSQPVKMLRLDFGRAAPATIAIDAVELSGPSGSTWASDARASSDNSASAPVYAPGSSGPDAVESLRAESPVSDWSENWLAYSPFDGVVVSAADLGLMTPAVFAAVGDYVHAGGNLIILGKSDLPATWHSARTKALPNGAGYEIGFGNVFAFKAENPAALDPAAVQRLREAVRETSRYFQTLPNDSGAANTLMPVVESLKVPTRGIVIIMLLFIILIGPVNMIYLSRIKRRTWMLWTIPVISLATTLLVFAYSLLREGITPDTRIAGVTVLDQASHRAATIGGEAFYCPLTPSGGLHFDFGTEATPLVSIDYGSGTPREVDWTQSQHFQHGWVSARVPEHFHLRKSETRRERIQVLNENGKMEVVNSLGAAVKSLWVADANMNIFQANNVAAGEKGGLLPFTSDATGAEKTGPQGLLHDAGFAAHEEGLAMKRYLLPNTYIAELESNPFIENALGRAASAKRTKSVALVFGILGAEDKVGGAK